MSAERNFVLGMTPLNMFQNSYNDTFIIWYHFYAVCTFFKNSFGEILLNWLVIKLSRRLFTWPRCWLGYLFKGESSCLTLWRWWNSNWVPPRYINLYIQFFHFAGTRHLENRVVVIGLWGFKIVTNKCLCLCISEWLLLVLHTGLTELQHIIQYPDRP